MRTQTAKRWTALVLTLVMALSLAVPSLAAVPMMRDVDTVEVPVEGAGTMPSHTHGALTETPAIGGGEAELMGNSYTLNLTTQSPSDSIFTVNGTVENLSDALKGKLTGEYAGYTKGLVLVTTNSTGDISFTAPSDGKTTIRLVHPSATKGFKVYENGAQIAKVTMGSNPYSYTFNVTSGKTYAIGKDQPDVRLLTIEFVPDVAPCDEHTWPAGGGWSEDTATCTEPGTQSRTCTVCGEKETRDTDPTGHTSKAVAKVEPTCVDPGTEAGTVCSECDALLTGCQEIPATGIHVDADPADGACDVCGKTPLAAAHDHNFTIEVKNTATCTAAGVKTMQCSVENCDVTTPVASTALGHDWKDVAAKAAACASVGWTAHKVCSRCQEKQGYVESPALGHDFGSDGKCSRCDAVMDSEGMNAGGWFETLYAEIDGVTDAQVASVVYNGPINGSLQDEDLEYLVRDAKLANGQSGVRIDIPGLPAGKYSLLVGLKNGMAYTATQIEVQEYDRSGYAHWNYTEGVGAYRDDGILKENAIVLYVTEENKNTVSVTAPDGTTVTGIGNILNTAGMDTGGGTTSNGGKPNTNGDILKKLAQAGIPLVVRIVGNVSSKHPAPQAGGIVGLTDYNSVDNGGSVKDQGNMARMKDAKDVTIEGIGADAVVNGWGFHFMASKGYPELGKSFEVRNVTFRNVPEDCIGMEGQHESGVAYNVERGWVHNCSFYAPSISPCTEGDKSGGDGACDFKRGEYFTMDYCYYESYHKTNLVGSGDSPANGTQHHITWHHNYYKNCESRGPLGRKANMHIYNCIYENQISYAQNTRTDCYIFSEYNSFQMSKQPRTVDGGAIKSFMDALRGCIEDGKDGPATDVTNRLQVVTSNNLYASFELDSEASYIPDGNYKLDKDHITARANVLAYAGPMKAQIVTPDEVDPSIVLADRAPTDALVLPYNIMGADGKMKVKAATGTVDNMKINIQTPSDTNLKFGKEDGGTKGQNIVFRVDEYVDLTMEGSGIALVNEAGAAVLSDAGTVEDLAPGVYFIEPNNMTPGKDGAAPTWKDGNLTGLTVASAANHEEPHVHSFGAYKVTRAATCTVPGLETATCSCGETETRELPKIDHNYVDGACEMCDLPQSVGYDPDASGTDIPTVVAVTGITLDQKSVTVDQDKAVTLVANVLPADATNKSVTWTSSDPDVATVSNSGIVTGKASGTTTITATTKDGGFTDSCTVTVIGITKTEKKFVANDYKPKTHDGAVTAADVTEIATKTGGDFTLNKATGTWRLDGEKLYLVLASKEGNAMEFKIESPLNTVTVSASSTGANNYSVIALLDGAGNRVADKTGATVKAVKGTSATTITFEDLPAGTYRIVTPDGVTSADVGGASGFEGRGVGIHSVTVTELQREITVVDEGNFGADDEKVTWTLNSTGQLTITDPNNYIAQGETVFVSLWDANNRFTGVKAINASQSSVMVGQNWDHLKLFWLNSAHAPKCNDETVNHK